MVAPATTPISAADEAEAFEQLPPLTKRAIVQCITPYSPTQVLGMFREHNWPLTRGEHDNAVAQRLYERDYAAHGNATVTMH